MNIRILILSKQQVNRESEPIAQPDKPTVVIGMVGLAFSLSVGRSVAWTDIQRTVDMYGLCTSAGARMFRALKCEQIAAATAETIWQ